MMSPRSRSADSRPPNSLVLARNCLAISFNPDPSRSSLPCKRCSGLEFIDDNEFSDKIKCQPMVISPSTASTYSSPFTSLSPSEPESKSSSIQSASQQQPSEEPTGKINCSSISTTLSDSSDSSSASSTSSTSTSSSPPSSPSSPSSSPPNYPCSCKSLTGLELFTSFVQQNYQCFWNPSLVSSVSTLNYTGFLLPSTILMIGSEYAYEVIRTAYARRILHPPLGYIIQSLGDVPLVEMSLVCQAKFTPLTEALCKCINDFNNRSTHVFLGDIAEAIKQSYPNIIPPTADMIKKTLRSLQRAGKVRFSTSEGYFLVKPTLTCESSILGTSLEPSSPCDTIKRESVKLYSSLMTPDEVISRLHGSPTSSTESAYFGSNGGVTLDTPNLMTPTSLNTTLNWDFGFNNVNGGTLLTDQSNCHEESDLISLRRSSSLRVSTTVKGMNRSQENDDSEKPLTLSSTPNVPFSRSKSLRMVNNKEKIKSLTIDSSETTIKSEPITIVVKKPSIFTKFLARLSYNGGNGNVAPGTKLKPEGNRKLVTNGMDQEINRPSQESKSTQTVSKPSSPVVLHRQKSGKVYRLPAVGGFNGGLTRKSSTLDSRFKCKPYGNLTSCMYCESLRTLSKSKRLNHAHQPMINNCCDLCSLIVKSNSSTSAVTASNEYNSRSFGLASVGPIVDPSCDKCISSLTYCCSNADCNISSPRLYSHYPSQHEHSSPYQLPNDHSNHHDSLHRQCLTLSSPTPSSSSPPPSPYSRFTLSPTLRPKTYFSPRLTSSSLGNNVSSTPLSYSPSSTLPYSSLTNSSPSTSTKTATTTINNNFEKSLAPISIQTNADTAERLTLTDNLINKTIPSLMTSQSPQKSLITTVGDLTNCNKLQEDQSLVIKGNPNDTSLSFITSGSTSNKNDSESFKISKDLAQDNLWNEIGGRQLEAELRETGITIGNSFNLKIEFGSPITTNQTKESTSSTTTSSSTTTLLSNGVAKSFTNFEEKSAENLPQNGFPPTTSSFPTSTPLPSPLSKSTSCNNQLVRSSLSSHMNGNSSANETSSVINSTSTVNVRTVTRTVGLNNEIECSNISPSSNNDHEQFTANYSHHDPGVKINQAFNTSSSFDTTLSDNENESKTDETNKPTTIAITTTTKVTGALTTSNADPHETVDSLGSNLIKKSTSISNIRQKVAQAKAAFFSSGDAGKITSAC